MLQILKQSYDDLLLEASPSLVREQLEAEVLCALLFEDQKHVTKNAQPLLSLKAHHSILLVLPALHQPPKALL